MGFVTVAIMPGFGDTKTASTHSTDNPLEALFQADLQYRSESRTDAVVAVMEGEFDEKTGRAIWNVYIPATKR